MMKRFLAGLVGMAMAASIFTFGFTTQSLASSSAITEEGAIAIAVENAKFDNVQNARAEKATVNGAEIFTVTFYVGKATVTYRIDAASGAVLGRTMNNAPIG